MESIIAPIYKKGDKTDCSNCRGISLSSTIYKILSTILLSWFTPYEEEIIGIISVDFEATDQLLIIHSAFVKSLRKKMGIKRSSASPWHRLEESL
jgi:hypothetical protein